MSYRQKQMVKNNNKKSFWSVVSEPATPSADYSCFSYIFHFAHCFEQRIVNIFKKKIKIVLKWLISKRVTSLEIFISPRYAYTDYSR